MIFDFKQHNCHGPTWTVEEDAMLIRLTALETGRKHWAKMVEFFPRRTPASIRNRYLRLMDGMKKPGKYVCQKCGKIRKGHVCTAEFETNVRR